MNLILLTRSGVFKRGTKVRSQGYATERSNPRTKLGIDRNTILVSSRYHRDIPIQKRFLAKIDENGNICSLRQRYTMKDKEFILTKTKGKCACCGKQLDLSEVTVDHAIPLNVGGSNHPLNLIPLCRGCNYDKGDGLLSISSYRYLNKDVIEPLSKYFVWFCTFNTRWDICNYITGNALKIKVEAITRLKSGKPFPLKVIRSLHVATYSDLDNLHSFIASNSNFLTASECKEHISDIFTTGSWYIISNKDDIKLALSLKIEEGYPTVKSLFIDTSLRKNPSFDSAYQILIQATILNILHSQVCNAMLYAMSRILFKEELQLSVKTKGEIYHRLSTSLDGEVYEETVHACQTFKSFGCLRLNLDYYSDGADELYEAELDFCAQGSKHVKLWNINGYKLILDVEEGYIEDEDKDIVMSKLRKQLDFLIETGKYSYILNPHKFHLD